MWNDFCTLDLESFSKSEFLWKFELWLKMLWKVESFNYYETIFVRLKVSRKLQQKIVSENRYKKLKVLMYVKWFLWDLKFHKKLQQKFVPKVDSLNKGGTISITEIAI
jgi:hypothetical protein